jgi:hypothetical protein
MQFLWRLLTGCDWQESRTELRHYYSSHRKRLAWLLVYTLGVILLIRLLNGLIGPLPAIPNPAMANVPGSMPEYWKFHFGFLAFPAIVVLMIQLPPTAAYPIELSRPILLPRKVLSIVLSVPLAFSYAMEGWFEPQLFLTMWDRELISVALHMLTVIGATALMASLLSSITLGWRFNVAAAVWLLCHIGIEIVGWSRFPVDSWYYPAFPSYLFFLLSYGAALSALLLIAWYRTRFIVFSLGNVLVLISYLLHWPIYQIVASTLGNEWGFGVFWFISWFSAGSTLTPLDNWTAVVSLIP